VWLCGVAKALGHFEILTWHKLSASVNRMPIESSIHTIHISCMQPCVAS